MDVRDDRLRSGGENGDDALFAALYRDLRRFAAVVGWPKHDPDDLVQEVVSRALGHGSLSSLDNPGAYLRTSIVRLASNGARGRFIREVAHRKLAVGQGDGAVDAYPSDLDELRHLGPQDRAVLYLSVVERRPFAEIAALLGIAEPAARKRSSRALAKLREVLTPPEGDS